MFEPGITVNLKGIEMKRIERFSLVRLLLPVIILLFGFGPVANGVDCFIDSTRAPVVKYCPASINNFSENYRTPEEINYIVIHTVQGSKDSAIHTFSSGRLSYPRSAHYTIGKDGEIIKSVPARKEAWHAGTSPLGSGGKYESRVLNENSIGIEHAGFVDDPNFPTEEQYISSAALTRYLCQLYDIPMDRNHIVGHEEIKSAKGDPGPNWNWEYYMDLVKHGYRGPIGEPVDTGSRAERGGASNFIGNSLVLIGAVITALGYIFG